MPPKPLLLIILSDNYPIFFLASASENVVRKYFLFVNIVEFFLKFLHDGCCRLQEPEKECTGNKHKASGSLSEVPLNSGIYVLFLGHRQGYSLILGNLEGRGGLWWRIA